MSEQNYCVPFTEAATASLGYDRSQLQAGIVHIGLVILRVRIF